MEEATVERVGKATASNGEEAQHGDRGPQGMWENKNFLYKTHTAALKKKKKPYQAEKNPTAKKKTQQKLKGNNATL